MSRTFFNQPAFRRTALLALIVSVGACEENRATTFAPVGALGFNFGVQTAVAGLPAGSATVSGGNTVTLALSGLRALQGGAVYQVWGYNPTATGGDSWTPLAGSVTETRLVAQCTSGAGCPSADTIRDLTDKPKYTATNSVVAAAGAGTYAGSDSTREPVTGLSWVLSVANGSTANPATFHAIVLSIESAAATTAPSAARFLYRRIQFGGSGAMQFGHFGGFDAINVVSSPLDIPFVASGSGAATIRGDEIVTNFVSLTRPPIGFYYRAVLQDSSGFQVLVDTLRSAYDGRTSLSRISLADADVNNALPTVSAREIKTASVRNCLSTSTELDCPNTLALNAATKFGPISTLNLVLEPKAAGTATLRGNLVSHGNVMSGTIPDPAKK